MKHQRVIPFVIGVIWLAIEPVSRAELKSPAEMTLAQQVEEVAARLEGVMDTSAQAAANSKAPNVRMTTCRIRVVEAEPGAAESVFLYQEQALSKNLAKPYRQRFLQIMPSRSTQSVRSLSFKPANPEALIHFCDRPADDRSLKAADLGQPVCSVFLRRSGEDYLGRTPIDGCPANVRGAVRITNYIVLSKTGMDTWDRGFDNQGKQVWGAQAESYQYRRSQ